MELLYGVTIAQFDQLWRAKHRWYEAPNYRRGGWSGVSQIDLETGQGKVPVYLKLQYRHSYRSWDTFFRKQPTALREYRNICRLHEKGIATVDLVVFGVREDTAILGTRALTDYQALDNLDWNALSLHQRRALIRTIAESVSKLHAHHYQHGCLYPKHIFVRHCQDHWQVKFIDLEKMKRRWRRKAAMSQDLGTLYRRSQALFNLRDQLTFLQAYLGTAYSRSARRHFIKKYARRFTLRH